MSHTSFLHDNQFQQDEESRSTVEARLKAVTGFSTYKAYLEHFRQNGLDIQYLSDLLQELERLGKFAQYEERVAENLRRIEKKYPESAAERLRLSRKSLAGCYVFDLDKDEQWKISLDLRIRKSSATDIFHALYHPPENSRFRIVIWDVHPRNSHLLDVIALLLRLDPHCVTALSIKAIWDGKPYLDSTESRPLFAKHAVIGDNVIVIGQYRAYKNKLVPFLLIAADFHHYAKFLPNMNAFWQETGGDDLPGLFSGNFDLQTEVCMRFSIGDWVLAYTNLLFRILSQEETNIEGEGLPLAALLAICRLECLKVQRVSTTLRTFLLKNRPPSDRMYVERETLRRRCEDMMDALEHLNSYISREHCQQWLQQPIYQKLLSETGRSITQATRLEAEVRDYLQTRSGAMALEETKKSIELSNYQIQESKRVKIFTILAFIYVPLNLATSIFGMNIQQLNQSGQRLSVFFTTAGIALAITGLSWFCIEQINSYLVWLERDPDKTPSPTPKYSIAVRIGMLVWLVRHGHTTWMRDTRAWFHLLSNSPRKGYSSEIKAEISAGDYVSRFCHRKYKHGQHGQHDMWPWYGMQCNWRYD